MSERVLYCFYITNAGLIQTHVDSPTLWRKIKFCHPTLTPCCMNAIPPTSTIAVINSHTIHTHTRRPVTNIFFVEAASKSQMLLNNSVQLVPIACFGKYAQIHISHPILTFSICFAYHLFVFICVFSRMVVASAFLFQSCILICTQYMVFLCECGLVLYYQQLHFDPFSHRHDVKRAEGGK